MMAYPWNFSKKFIPHHQILNLLHINQSLRAEIFPDELKIARLFPIYKKGDDGLADNSSPISILPVISKVFETVICIQLHEHFKNYKLLYVSQHGFRKLHSTEFAAVELVDNILKHLDKGSTHFTIFLYLSKAFDILLIIESYCIGWNIMGQMNPQRNCFQGTIQTENNMFKWMEISPINRPSVQGSHKDTYCLPYLWKIWATGATISILNYTQMTQPFLAHYSCLKLRKPQGTLMRK